MRLSPMNQVREKIKTEEKKMKKNKTNEYVNISMRELKNEMKNRIKTMNKNIIMI